MTTLAIYFLTNSVAGITTLTAVTCINTHDANISFKKKTENNQNYYYYVL